MTLEILSRDEALRIGASNYFTGRPCQNGHVCERYVVGFKCRECVKARNATSGTNRSATYRERHPEKRKASALAWHRKSFAADPDGYRAKVRALRARNPETYREKDARWRRLNPEKRAAKERKRRARKRSAGGSHTASDVAAIRKAQKNRCAHSWCRADLSKTRSEVDHIVPLARGGSNDRRNIQVLCRECNRVKHARDPICHAQSMGMLL